MRWEKRIIILLVDKELCEGKIPRKEGDIITIHEGLPN